MIFGLFFEIWHFSVLTNLLRFEEQISENTLRVKNIFFVKSSLDHLNNIIPVSKQKYSFTIFQTISKLGIFAVTSYHDLGAWPTELPAIQ